MSDLESRLVAMEEELRALRRDADAERVRNLGAEAWDKRAMEAHSGPASWPRDDIATRSLDWKVAAERVGLPEERVMGVAVRTPRDIKGQPIITRRVIIVVDESGAKHTAPYVTESAAA